MPFKVTYQIDPAVFEAAESEVVWTEVQKITVPTLLQYLKKFLKSRGWTLYFCKIADGALGEHFIEEARINISIKIRFEELPAVLTHELLHGVLPQLEEARILTLERKVLQNASENQMAHLVHFCLKYGKWSFGGPYKKRVPSA